MGVGSAPVDDNGKPVLALWNDATGQPIPVHVGATVTGADGKTYALLDVNATVQAAANQRVNAHSGDFVAGSIVDLATLLTLAGSSGDAGTVASFMGRFTALKSDLDTLSGIVSGSKGAVKAGAGDFADLASILTALQGVLQVKRSAVAVYSLASAATTSSSNSGDLAVGAYTEIALDINTTAQTGTNPTVQFFYERKAADGLYYVLWQSSVLTAAANTLSTSIGAGMAYSQSLGVTGRLRWVIGGTATPGYTFSANIQGK